MSDTAGGKVARSVKNRFYSALAAIGTWSCIDCFVIRYGDMAVSVTAVDLLAREVFSGTVALSSFIHGSDVLYWGIIFTALISPFMLS